MRCSRGQPASTHARTATGLSSGWPRACRAGPPTPTPQAISSRPGASLRESAGLGQAQRQPCARDDFEGPSGESAGSLSPTGTKGISAVTVSTVKTTSFFVYSAPIPPKHLRGQLARSKSTDSEMHASPGARTAGWRFHGLLHWEEPPGPKKGPPSAVVLLGRPAENTPGFAGGHVTV